MRSLWTALQSGAIEVQAVALAEEILVVEPHNIVASMVVARSLRDRGEAAAATKEFESILSQFPDCAPAQKELASLYMRDPDKLAEAGRLAKAARATLPKDRNLAVILAEISYRDGNYSQVQSLLEEA